MSDEVQLQLELPELEAHPAELVKAAHASLDELRTAGLLQPRHAVQAQLVLELARAIDRGARSGRASATAMAARELRETMLVLDPPPEDGNAEADALRRMREFMAELERAAQRTEGGQT